MGNVAATVKSEIEVVVAKERDHLDPAASRRVPRGVKQGPEGSKL